MSPEKSGVIFLARMISPVYRTALSVECTCKKKKQGIFYKELTSMKYLFKLSAAVGVFLIWGAAGSTDAGSLTLSKAFLLCVFGIVLIAISALGNRLCRRRIRFNRRKINRRALRRGGQDFSRFANRKECLFRKFRTSSESGN